MARRQNAAWISGPQQRRNGARSDTGDFDPRLTAAATGVDYAFSPDGKELAYVRNPDKSKRFLLIAISTCVPLSGGPAKNITAKTGVTT